VAQFLSREWIEELDAAARSASSRVADIGDRTIMIQQVVQEAPGGEARYYLEIGPGGMRVRPGSADAPVLTFLTHYDMARALQTGEANAQEALLAGRLKIQGELELVAGRENTFAALDDVFATVRADMTYPR
jgi:hypothetical protein